MVLGINIQQSKSVVQNWASQLSLTYTILLDVAGSIWYAYHNPGWYIPHNVVIDPELIVRYSDYGYSEAQIKNVIETYLPTDVTSTSPALPGDEVLINCYPNPVAANTYINLVLPFRDDFTLQIFDILGRRIKTVSRGSAPVQKTFFWDKTDAAGNAVPAGVYFLVLKTARLSRSVKIMVLK